MLFVSTQNKIAFLQVKSWGSYHRVYIEPRCRNVNKFLSTGKHRHFEPPGFSRNQIAPRTRAIKINAADRSAMMTLDHRVVGKNADAVMSS